ncbi:MAG: T9SS type A sorting domain-containing protein [Flavobacterium sp.]|nr:T9SS type A sorting domain-containing protein [Flavobacterium sp.]
MKKLIYLLLLVPFCVNAQIINFPDPLFKAKLLQASSINEIAYTTSNNYNKIDTNNNGEIELSEAALIKRLYVGSSGITSLEGITNFVNLEFISCGQNSISTIDLSGLNLLTAIWAEYNQLTNIDISPFQNLTTLSVGNNQLQNLDISNNPNIGILYCDHNQLQNLDLSNLTGLWRLDCSYNQIQTIDLSNNATNMIQLYAGNNPNLTTLLVKNGYEEWEGLTLSNCPNLNYICVDDFQLTFMQAYIQNVLALPNCTVNTYCSFIPGGDFNVITGTTTFDSDNNGCDDSDLPKPNIKININDGTNQGASFSNNSGDYNFYTQAGTFTLTPNIENPSWFTFLPATATIPFADNNNNISEQNFCISPNGVHHDLEVVIAPITPARPGFDATYEIVFKNKGNQTLSGNVSLTFDDDKTDFVSSNPNPNNLNLNSLSWDYTNLLPFESRVVQLTLNVNGPTETPAVNIGDVLHFTATINPTAGDEFPNDNTFNYNQIVVGSYDPNNIECLEGEVVAPSYIGQYLHYAVNFENTGNYPAENIVVKIIIDTTKYDINSLQLLNVSHNSYTRITGNIVEVIFQQINLDSGGHGNLLFKIRTSSNLVEGNSVAKRADIFFDYNAPIDTGMANTTFEVLNNSVFELDDTISIYPNPTSSIININGNFNIKTIELYDVQGRLLQTQLLDEIQTSIDISEKSNGIYFLKITSDKGSKVEKIVKE